MSIMLVAFWGAYVMMFLSSALWLAKHPLSIGACVLLLYMGTSLIVGLVASFVMGVFLFLTGVSGMMVAFLYVVALCPNPVFKSGVLEASSGMGEYFLVLVGVPGVLLCMGVIMGFGVEMGLPGESSQWLRDPCMLGGLAELMPVLGVILFLCMVSVVSLCGQQKQCLGGYGLMSTGGGGVVQTKRSYA
uniref:NADH dehydrogenase subunit 6 n=2 Tax=Hiatula TaxID=2341033 RepID=A0A4P8KYS9_9BIVA|nr:NADH dehydrogenase subunit 6 [Hiatula diphos]YP_009642893.1 NADH dehydrogenase subunit 6 [Hiatula acuta]AEV94287.1 NADH dehydrogenase subunit 6 [Hiatula diphos]QCQ20457.1 NADH dehydrogenase subunit 6 [Hiatula acuta]